MDFFSYLIIYQKIGKIKKYSFTDLDSKNKFLADKSMFYAEFQDASRFFDSMKHFVFPELLLTDMHIYIHIYANIHLYIYIYFLLIFFFC